MRTSALFITLILFAGALSAQTRITGTVKDGKGHPIHGASIAIKDSYDGATTDSLGKFHFQATDKGSFTLITTNIGYNSVEQPVTLAGTPIELHIVLKEQLSELKAVTITAGSFTAGDAKRGAVLSALDVATTAGSNADITVALKTLPGAQQIGEQEGLFVRGGAGYEAKQYIDGTLVNNPYYTSVPDIAQRGRFSPFLFKGTVFSTGGYSALYGEALSSVVLLESIDLPEKSEIDATLSPLVVGLGTQQLAKNKQSSYGFSYDYVNAYAYFKAIPQDVDYFRMPQFHNADANFRIRTKSGGMLKYYTTFAYNDLGLRRQDWDSLNMKDAFSLTNHNWYNNLSYREYLNNGWKMDLGAGYSTNLDNLGQQVQSSMNQPVHFGDSVYWMNGKFFNIDQRQDLTQVRAVFDKKLGTLSAIRFGSEYWYSYNYQKYRSPQTYIDTMYKFKDNFNSLFAESDIYITNALAAKVGVRFEHSSVINRSDLAPRLSLAYRTGPQAQVSLAYGVFYQKPENSQLFASGNVGFTKATHYIINYQKMSKDRVFRVEAYYKKYEDLIKTVPLSNYNTFFTTYNNTGSGYAKGIELFWRDKKSIKDFDYWISYSYLDTKRNYLNYTGQLTPNFAATHTASIVMKRFFMKYKSGVNVTYSYATGRPYYNFILNGLKYNLAEQGKTKDYNSLNLSAEWVPTVGNPKAKTFVVLFASVTNVLGYNSVYGYNFSYSGLNKQPITPPAKRFYFVGCFLSWGVDRSQDAINNNL
ncbi:MAG TPA: TonB-dependent receptor [Puia sp.]|jgi:vitamin B12 transporter|nr:TonB-dependent receptor [Puia sp.]